MGVAIFEQNSVNNNYLILKYLHRIVKYKDWPNWLINIQNSLIIPFESVIFKA